MASGGVLQVRASALVLGDALAVRRRGGFLRSTLTELVSLRASVSLVHSRALRHVGDAFGGIRGSEAFRRLDHGAR